MTEWREGGRGALSMGVWHGTFCLGRCWLLMTLLFVAGAMNLSWMTALTILILVEKVAPFGVWMSRLTGWVFVGWGAWMLVGTMI